MTPDYADSSFVISLYCDDQNTEEARRFMARRPTALAFNPFHRLEVFNGLRLRVHRGEMTREERAATLRRIDENLSDGILAHSPLPWTDALRKAGQLSADHAERIGSRSADTLHVAAAVREHSLDTKLCCQSFDAHVLCNRVVGDE